MKNCLLNWNFKKQLIAEIICYGGVAAAGNAFLGKKQRMLRKTKNPKKIIQRMPKKQKIFNGVLFGCFAVDVTASYFLLKYLKEKLG